MDASKYTPDFKPKLDEVGGKSGSKLRATTEARFLAQSQRPQTAPELRPKPTRKFTLAADHSPKQPAEQSFEGKAFVLDGSTLGMVPPLLSKSSIDFFPPPVTPTAAGQKLKESATSTGYVGALARTCLVRRAQRAPCVCVNVCVRARVCVLNGAILTDGVRTIGYVFLMISLVLHFTLMMSLCASVLIAVVDTPSLLSIAPYGHMHTTHVTNTATDAISSFSCP